MERFTKGDYEKYNTLYPLKIEKELEELKKLEFQTA